MHVSVELGYASRVERSTIAAIATPPGRGAIGVIRVSGPRAKTALQTLCPGLEPQARVATVARLIVDGAAIDQALILFFPGPRSYTGEDVVELQVHGAPRLLELVLARVTSVPGVRVAEPGEFTRRAVMAGRLDAGRAEAVIDLIDARSEAEVKSAAARLDGALSTVIGELQRPLVELSALLEGALDFPDESEGVEAEISPKLDSAVSVARRLEAQAFAASRPEGALVVLYGPVNAGKSTLFNRLVGSERALVDDEPGTTRDAIEASVEWNGQHVRLVDTAGLRVDAGRVEAMGIERTRQLLREADVAVLLVPPGADGVTSWRDAVEAERRIEALSKADQTERSTAMSVSGLSGEGVEALKLAVMAKLAPRSDEASVLTRRHGEALRRAREALERAVEAREATLEVVAGEVALAMAATSELAGLNPTQERLDALFLRFCIGK